jgi:hypothetical protein
MEYATKRVSVFPKENGVSPIFVLPLFLTSLASKQHGINGGTANSVECKNTTFFRT